jgi:hypothetical protein
MRMIYYSIAFLYFLSNFSDIFSIYCKYNINIDPIIEKKLTNVVIKFYVMEINYMPCNR